MTFTFESFMTSFKGWPSYYSHSVLWHKQKLFMNIYWLWHQRMCQGMNIENSAKLPSAYSESMAMYKNRNKGMGNGMRGTRRMLYYSSSSNLYLLLDRTYIVS